jgi:curli biogenesis system outer membrane secretion channel CsgG
MMRRQLGLIALAALATLASAQGTPQNKQLKLRIAVAPLDYGNKQWFENWNIPVEFRNAIDEKLAQKLFETGRFIVLEREAMSALLDEKAIKEENTGQSQKGKIIPAQALVRGKLTDFTLARRGTGASVNLGSIGRVGGSVSEAKVALNITIFDVDTSELLASAEAAGKASSSSFKLQSGARFGFADFGTFENSPLGEATTKALDATVQKVLEKLGDQPWSARVADFDASSKEITINAGSETGVKVGDTFDLQHISKVIKDPETGQVLRVATTKTGKVRIKEVDKKFSVAELIEGTAAEVGDLVKEIKG